VRNVYLIVFQKSAIKVHLGKLDASESLGLMLELNLRAFENINWSHVAGSCGNLMNLRVAYKIY
jgi:hypothetical protein